MRKDGSRVSGKQHLWRYSDSSGTSRLGMTYRCYYDDRFSVEVTDIDGEPLEEGKSYQHILIVSLWYRLDMSNPITLGERREIKTRLKRTRDMLWNFAARREWQHYAQSQAA